MSGAGGTEGEDDPAVIKGPEEAGTWFALNPKKDMN
jgi:hypothetical protein